MERECRKCTVVADGHMYDGENGYFCTECLEKMQDKFHEIFGVDTHQISGFSGVLLDLADLYKILDVVERNDSMNRYYINDADLARAE